MEPDEDLPTDREKYDKIRRESKKETVPCQDNDWEPNNPIQKETEKYKKTQNNYTTKTGGRLRQLFQTILSLSTVYISSHDNQNMEKKLFIPIRFMKRIKLKYGRQNRKKKKDNRYKGSCHHILFYDKTYGFLFIFWGLIGTSYCKIEVTLLDKLVVFGDNVTLICSCDNNVEQGHVWTKGNDNTQLTLGVSSNDTEKYKPSLSKDSDRYLYSLKITNFLIMDLDYYNCQFGFERTSYKLSLDKRFAYIPRNDEIISNVSHGGRSLNMTIQIQNVFPDPECEISVQGYDLTNKTRILRKQSSKLYEVFFTISWLSPDADNNCTVVVKLKCALPTTQFYHRRNVTSCEEDANRSSNGTGEIMMIMIPLVILLVVVLLLVVIYKRRRTNNSFCRNIPSEEDQISGRSESQYML